MPIIEGEKIKNTFKNLNVEILFLTVMMSLIWINSDLWPRSFWINETDTLSFAKFGVEGFGLGFGPLVYFYHLLIVFFGETDYVFRMSSLFFSLITMMAIYQICRELGSEKSASFFAANVFIISSYSIEFGLQIRSYAINTMCVSLIMLWAIKKIKEPIKEFTWIDNFFTLLVCFAIWPPSSHYFSNLYLFFFFFTIFIMNTNTVEMNKKSDIFKSPFFPPITTLVLMTGVKIFDMINAVINSSQGKNYTGSGKSGEITIDISEFLFAISSDSNIILLSFIIGLFSIASKIKTHPSLLTRMFFTIIIINFTVPLSASLILQHYLSGFYLLRY